MGQNAALAEVKFPQYAVNLYGRVEQMNNSSIRIRLETLPSGEHVLRAGNEAQLMVVARGVIYRASVLISGAEASRITMRFSSPPQAVQRRHQNRRACDVNVSFRTLSNGCAGAWQDGTATDMSVGGMRLVADRRVESATELDLLFLLNGGMAPAAGTDNRSQIEGGFELMAPGADTRPVKAFARIAHRAMLEDGSMALGVMFRKLSSFDQLRLMRYTEAEVAGML